MSVDRGERSFGYDLPIAPRLRAGIEASLTGRRQGQQRHIRERAHAAPIAAVRLRATARIGVLIRQRGMFYILGGYGGNRYSIDNSAGVAEVHPWGSSFVVGTGLQYAASRRIGIRIEYKHVDNQSHQFLVGVPIRL